MQSQSVFDEVQPIEDAFLNNAFIDVLLEDIEYFDLKNSENNYIFAIKQKNKDRVFAINFIASPGSDFLYGI